MKQVQSPYINIHTHHYSDNQIALLNIGKEMPLIKSAYLSAGIHPWEISVNSDKQLLHIKQMLKNQQLTAIGECGIDRSINTDIKTQRHWLIKQFELAKTFNKPLIIHCVRAYSDLLQIIKLYPEVVTIFHGYNANRTITKQLLKHNVMFSFGQSLISEHAKTLESFLYLPSDKIFLETDDNNFTIKQVYSAAARVKEMSVSELRDQVYSNFTKIFS